MNTNVEIINDPEWDQDCVYQLAKDGIITQEMIDTGQIRDDLVEVARQGITDAQKEQH